MKINLSNVKRVSGSAGGKTNWGFFDVMVALMNSNLLGYDKEDLCEKMGYKIASFDNVNQAKSRAGVPKAFISLAWTGEAVTADEISNRYEKFKAWAKKSKNFDVSKYEDEEEGFSFERLIGDVQSYIETKVASQQTEEAPAAE